MRKDGLQSAYELIIESEKKGTVDAPKVNRINQSFEGAEKAKPTTGNMGIQSPAAKSVDSAKEAPKNLNPGHGKIATEGTIVDKEIRNMLPKSQFDELVKSQIVEEESIDAEESPLERGGADEFNDTNGDFPPAEGDAEAGEDVGEEVDVATELRMIIDRLTEVAERLGAFEGEGEEEGIPGGEPEMDEPEISPESVQRKGRSITEAPVATKELKPLPDSVKKMTGKSFKVDSAFNVTSNKEGDKGGPGKDSADGKIKAAKKTTLGPKMSMKADAKGPMSKPGAGLFDAV